MGRVITKTISDGVEVSDDTPPLVTFCLDAHVHFQARDLNHALSILGHHFLRSAAHAAAGEVTDHPFTGGHMNLGRAPAGEEHEEVKH